MSLDLASELQSAIETIVGNLESHQVDPTAKILDRVFYDWD